MPGPDRSHLSDLRGAARMVTDATRGVAEIVETTHRTIHLLPGPFGRPARDRTSGITGLVYRSVLGGMRLVGRGIDASLAQWMEWLPEAGSESTPTRDAFVSALNGVCGDHLQSTGNPLAIEMSLRYHGGRVRPEDPASEFDPDRAAPPTGKLVLLVHGLCRNDRHWARAGHDHGAALADELGYTPLYLRYNSGLRVASNGKALSEVLETLIASWTPPVEELVILGHSMGGLVARSACHHARLAGHAWPHHLRKLVFLGTPHHGAPLVLSGQWHDSALELSPYSAPIARIGKMRSAGIIDLQHGSITTGTHEHVPVPVGIECYALAASRDGLVPVASALGRHDDAARTLAIPQSHQWIGCRMSHFELLHRPEVYAQLRAWLAERQMSRA